MVSTGLDRLTAAPGRLTGRRYAILGHGASVTGKGEPIHLALSRLGQKPSALFGPEHGFYGVEQDMVAARGGRDPWTGAPVISLYGDSEQSLRPDPASFSGLDLLVIDLQDVGSRYYTYAATAVWAAQAAVAAGCEVWVLDRPNPLGGRVEGNLPEPGFESFVGAFRMPVCHGLTLAELVRFELLGTDALEAVELWSMEGWSREMSWEETGLPWIAPSPNMPTLTTARIYPGGCLVEATEFSEGRGTTRPFQLFGAPHLDPVALATRLEERQGRVSSLQGVGFLPTYFRPQFQKHSGQRCGGVELWLLDSPLLEPYRLGVELLAAAWDCSPENFSWRQAPYEFVIDRPAIDLLTGGETCRRALEAGSEGRQELEDWMQSWRRDEREFRRLRRRALLYEDMPSDQEITA